MSDQLRRAQRRGYVDRIIDRDVPDVMGRRVRNQAALRHWLLGCAAATATVRSYERIRDAATSGEGDTPARTTTQPYRDTLEAVYVVNPGTAWLPTTSHIGELTGAPEHHLADPALAATVDDSDVRHLHWFRRELGDDLLDAVVVTTGPYAYRRPDGIAAVSAALLGP